MLMKAIKKVRISTEAFSPRQKTNFLPSWLNKHVLLILTLAILSFQSSEAQRAKYVFYFIGDGMGVNQVNGAETYLAALDGRIGTTPLLFPSFPYVGLITTQSADHGITDSAAAGTALAGGKKTYNGAIGLMEDRKTPIISIAQKAKEHGAAVGVTTSVTVDHATPAVFYAHAENRNMYYEIGKQLAPSGFDFFAGSDFMSPTGENEPEGTPDLYQQTTEAGYTIVRGYDEYLAKCNKADKMVLFQPKADSEEYVQNIPYKVEQQPGNLSLQQITRAAIDFLSKKQKQKKGFFVMIEGGMIDKACHANDAASYIHELIDMDSCVRIAYDFYLKHPKETLIVITADHETGGLSLGRGGYQLNLDKLRGQKISVGRFSRDLKRTLKAINPNEFTWEYARNLLRKNFGIWDVIEPKASDIESIRAAYDKLAAALVSGDSKLSNEINDFTYAAAHTCDRASGIGWQSGSHSNGYVGVYAIGAGADQFTGRFDNTQIPLRIMKAAGWDK